jgi:hypothetical protein
MSDMTMHEHDAAGAKGSVALAIFLWVAVVCALAYGLINTFTKVVDLFTG